MNKQVDIPAFHKLLNSKSEDDDFWMALKKLTQIRDADTLDDIRAYDPFAYSWRWSR